MTTQAIDPEVMSPESDEVAAPEPFIKDRGPVRRFKDAIDRPADTAEAKALSILLTATKAALGTLIEGMDERNASRTLAQVGQVTEAQRSALQILGAHVSPEDFGRWSRRAGGQMMHGSDRETAGVSAMGAMIALWQASERPKALASLLQAAASAKELGDESLVKMLTEQGKKLAEELGASGSGAGLDAPGKGVMSAMVQQADTFENPGYDTLIPSLTSYSSY